MLSMTRRAWIVAAALVVALGVAVAVSIWFWGVLVEYINPRNATGRKDAVQVFALIVAGVVAAITAAVGFANLRVSWRNLEQQRELEAQRAQSRALQAYYEQMGQLITEHDLRNTERDDVKLLARAQTLAVLKQLDGVRKGTVIAFLSGAGLINRGVSVIPFYSDYLGDFERLRGNPIVSLHGASLKGAELTDIDLKAVSLNEVDLTGANLTGVDLATSTLNGANLTKTILEDANLVATELEQATLTGANLKGADLSEKGGGAGLPGAYLGGAEGLTAVQLDEAKSLEGTTMPNGQKYQDWLRDRDNHRGGGG